MARKLNKWIDQVEPDQLDKLLLMRRRESETKMRITQQAKIYPRGAGRAWSGGGGNADGLVRFPEVPGVP